MDMCLPGGAPIAFGRYAFDPWRGELHGAGARPVVLGGCAARVLQALIEAAGHVLTPAQLIERAWPGRAIHASNLRVQIGALRRVLAGDRGLIGTVTGHGYVFTGRVAGAAALPPLPALVGRATLLDLAARHCAAAPIVTLTGPAGVGKSVLALAVAHRQRAMPCRFIDLDVAADSLATLTPATLGHGPLLLVLDNCDHHVDAVSRMAEALTRHLPALRILVTGRQALRADGETVVRVPPLERAAAVQLFSARAFAMAPDPATRALAAQVCDRFDGVPLALVLAAAHVRAVGSGLLAALADPAHELAALSDDTAIARHRSLRAALAWDRALLPAPAGRALAVLRQLPSWFTLADAALLLPGADVVDCLATLAAHSLLIADTASTPGRYRLLATTRA